VKDAGLRTQEEIPSTGTKDPYKLTADQDSKLRITRSPSLGKQQRGEAAREAALSSTTTTPQGPGPDSDRTPSRFADITESARILTTEILRLQAEKAQNQNMVMELSLDGDHILWINYAWENVVGCASSHLYDALALLF